MENRTGTIRRAPAALLVAFVVAAALAASPPHADAAKRPKCLGKKATIVSKKRTIRGTNRADVIVGTKRSQKILGKGGNDLICGKGGKDNIQGGPGNDRIDGGGGLDYCTENAGAGTKVACESPLVNLGVAKTGAGAGFVASSPGGIACGTVCSRKYLEGTGVTLNANASLGSLFQGWSGGGCSGTGACKVSLYAAKSVTATFALNGHALTTVRSGSGSGTVTSSPSGISCGVDCSETLAVDSQVTLTAAPSVGSVFTGWSGDCAGTSTCLLTMSGPKTATAEFTLARTLTIDLQGSGSGTVTSLPAGVNCGGDCTEDFADGQSVTLTATPAVGSVFTSWSGCDSTLANACTLVMNTSRSATATFTTTNYNLSVNKTGSGAGTVTSSPAGISCGGDCSEIYGAGTSVTLSTVPDSGSVFTGWSGGGCSGTGTCVVSVDAAVSVTAQFTVGRTLTVSKGGTGSGTVTSSPAGVNCGNDCDHEYADATSVTLTAAAASGSTFTGWAGCDSENGNECTVAMGTSRSVTANFTLQTHLLTVNRTGSGTISSNPSGISCGVDCTETYLHGTAVTLSAAPAAGWAFSGWSGACSGTNDSCNVSVDAATTVNATFVQEFTLTVTKTGAGSGTVTSSGGGINCGPTCSKVYTNGQTTTLTATPASGNSFAGWTGGDCSGTGTCLVTMTSNLTVTAQFEPITHTLTVTKSGSGGGTVTSSPSGISCGGDCSETYGDGVVVTLTANPDASSAFTGWSGSGCSGVGACVVTMDAAHAVTATFTANRTLSVSKDGTGGGTVSSSPAGINCGGDCSETYLDGTSVTLTATPQADSTFTSWSGCDSTSGNQCTVAMNGTEAVTATFTKITYVLTVSRTGSGGGSVASSPSGISCGADCTETYDSGTSVTLTATADGSSTFTAWSGGGCSGSGSCVVTMSAATTVTATFTANRTLTVSKNGTGSGTVSSSPSGVNCGGDCSETYLDGTVVTLTATPSADSTFTSWSGCDSTNGAECTLTMNGTESVTATFTKITYLLTVNRTGSGGGSVSSNPSGITCGVDCTETYDTGTSVTLSATPDGTSAFTGWSGAGCSGTGSCVVTMDAAKSVTATFVAAHTLTVSKDGTGSGTVASDISGIACGGDCTENYLQGTSVVLTATPASGSTFTSWTGCTSSTGNECTVTMSSSRSVTTMFTLNTYLLTAGKNGSGSGTVTSSPSGINCGGDCTEVYDHGTSVTLTASPAGGSVFSAWSGCDSTSGNQCTVTMTSVKTVTATFTAQFDLNVTKNGTGEGTVSSSPSGIDCGSDCDQTYDSGTVVTLTATADSTSIFGGWSGAGCSGTGTCVATMDAAKSVTATFTRLTLSLTKSSMGTVSSSPEGINCGTDCTSASANYGPDTVVTLTASGRTPLIGTYTWGGDCSGTSTTCVVTMSQARSVTITIT